MRLAELSERGGITTATVKYYLREGLLPPGRRVTATQSEYDESHLRRLRLIRALTQVGGLPMTTVREVLAVVDDDSQDQHGRIGAAVWALPHGPETTGGDPAASAAESTTRALLESVGWSFGRLAGPASPAYRKLVDAVAALHRLGYPCEVENLLPYAEAASRLARTELDLLESYDDVEEQIEATVACTVLYEPVLLSLRRLAEAEECNRRFGGGS